MITKRLFVLQAALVVGLGSVFFIPSKTRPSPAGIALVLPTDVGEWHSDKEEPITKEELAILSKDTGFARRKYTNPAGDEVTVGIVLSGEDMMNSIHRPERCLPAQGWTVARSERRSIPLANGRPLEVTKLTNIKEGSLDGKTHVMVHNLNYYWFIGSQDVTASHLQRTFIDMRDRVLHGENQRWAYVTVTSFVTDNLKPHGRTEEETTQIIENLVSQIVPEFKRPAAESANLASR